MILSNYLILCLSLLLLLQSSPASGSFPMSQFCIRWPKYWSLSFSICPSDEYSGLISSRIDFFDCLAAQETLKSLLQHHNFKASVLQCSVFFMVQISHPYMTTGKSIALIVWTFVSKVLSLLLNTLSRLVIAFLPRNKCLWFSWLQALSAVILEPKKIKSVTVSTFSLSICHEVMEPDAMTLVFWMLSFKPDFSLSSWWRWLHQAALYFLFIFCHWSIIICISVDISPLALSIPAWDSSSTAFHMMCSAYMLNKQGDNIQPCHTPFPIFEPVVTPCLVLTVASWPVHTFLRRQVRWSGIAISLRIFHSLVRSMQSKALA